MNLDRPKNLTHLLNLRTCIIFTLASPRCRGKGHPLAS